MSDGSIDQIIENKQVRQRPEEGFRRWFMNRYFDIILWYDKPDGQLLGFQFCYGKPYDERAYTFATSFTSHHFVSSHTTDFREHPLATAVLKGDAGLIPEAVIEKFRDDSYNLDQDLLTLILDKIGEYNSKHR